MEEIQSIYPPSAKTLSVPTQQAFHYFELGPVISKAVEQASDACSWCCE